MKPFRRNFFEQHENGNRGHPPDVHHARHEQEGHEKPTTTGAVSAVFEAHDQRAELAFAPIRHEKAERRTAAQEAGILERRPLKNARGDEQRAAESATPAHHHRRQQRGGVENPLCQSGQRAERRPGGEIARQKNPRGHKRPLLFAAFAVQGGQSQDHGRRGGRHHRDHHFGPHEKQRKERGGRPRLRVRPGHSHAGAFTDAGVIHGAGFVSHVTPRKRGDGEEPGQHDGAVALEHRFERGRRVFQRTGRIVSGHFAFNSSI